MSSLTPRPGLISTPTTHLSQRMLSLALTLGVGVLRCPRPRYQLPTDIALRALSLAPGQCLYLHGPSGAGKTTTLNAIASLLRRRGRSVQWLRPLPRSTRAVIELLDGDITQALAAACDVGLSEAPLLLRPATALSQGESWRLRLAIAMQRCKQNQSQLPPFLLADGWCEQLDDHTATCVSTAFSRWSIRRGVCLIAASTKPAATLLPGAIPIAVTPESFRHGFPASPLVR